MKLEPIYLVAPRPPKSTRRALLLAGVGFTTGACIGGAFGYCLRGPTTTAIEDPTLQWLRGLADDRTAIEELARHHRDLVAHMSWNYPDDPVLWHGVARLATALVAGRTIDD